MAEYSGLPTSPISVDPTNPQHELEKNKFVFIKRNKEHTLLKPSTILINPHFKENKKVFLNPNFQIAKNETIVRPKVHVNPNILKSLTSGSWPVANTENVFVSNPSITNFTSLNHGASLSTDRKSVATVESRNDQVQTMHKPTAPIVRNNYFQTQRGNSFCKINSSFDNRNNVFTKTKIVNLPQKTPTQEKLILKPILHQKPAVSLADRLKSIKESNLTLDPSNSRQNQRMVHTRLKIVNISKTNQSDIISPLRKKKSDVQIRDKSISSRFKYIRKEGTLPKTSPLLENKKSGSLKNTITNRRKGDMLENSSVRKNSIITRFKYIRNGAKLVKINNNPMKSKYKIVNNTTIRSPQAKKTKIISSPYRKKYVYVNKYNSSSFLANNVILKNSKQRNLIKINGILYQNAPCLLKRASLLSKTYQSHSGLKGKVPVRQLVKCQGKYKIVRSPLASATKLKKSNMTCLRYKKTGKCDGQKTGTCIKVHNPNQIILCKRFLQGVCRNNNCLLSHKVSSEKMPTCKYFLEGLCNKTECQYLHVKISPNADICKDFLEGFCKEGIKCDKRHQFLCPEYEKTQKCSKPKCGYPHGTYEVIKPKPEKKKLRKIIPKKSPKKTIEHTAQEVSENCQIRYYKENSDKAEEAQTTLKRTIEDEEVVLPKRKKLGSLPSFIPIL